MLRHARKPGTSVVLLIGLALAGCQSGHPAPTAPPDPPTGVSAVAGDGRVMITWTSSDALAYRLYWSTSPGVTRATGQQIAGVTSPYTHADLVNGQRYYYVLTAISAVGESRDSDEVAATPQVPAPPAPGLSTQIAVALALPGGNQDIVLVDTDSGAFSNLTNTPDEDDDGPVWSPNGSAIAFRSDRDGGGVFVMNADGTGAVKITPDGFAPAWSPDGTRIAVNFGGNIFTLAPDGSDRRQVTFGGGDQYPSWSPDGTRIAFEFTQLGEIWVASLDGSSRVRLAPEAPITAAAFPAWSLDGAQIAFQCSTPGALPDVCIMNADGSAARKVTTAPAFDGLPSWSQDGRIAFSSGLVDGQPLQPFALDPDTGAVTRLATLETGTRWPRWCPGISATAGIGEVTLRWNPASGAATYNLYFAERSGVTKATGTRVENVTEPMVHAGLVPGRTYHYVVTAVNAGGEGPESPEVAAVPIAAP